MVVVVDVWQFLCHSLFTGTWVMGLIMAVLRVTRWRDLMLSSDLVRSTNLLLFCGGLVYALFLLATSALFLWSSIQREMAPLPEFRHAITWSSLLDLFVFLLLPLAAIHQRLRHWPLLPVVAMVIWTVAILFIRDVLIDHGVAFQKELKKYPDYMGRILLYSLLQLVFLWWL